jgi:hypothetical protein
LLILLRYLAAIFIDTFGITHPSAEERDRATRYIALLIGSLFLALGVVVFLVVHLLGK